MNCHKCAKAKETKLTKTGLPRIPSGWKRLDSGPICNACLHANYILRAITVPVAYPVKRTSKELWTEMGKCWRMSTELANFTVTELAVQDHVRRAEDKKLPKFEAPYLYPRARARVPDFNPQSVTALLRSVEQRYRKRRYEVIWQSSASLPRYKYPVPYPVHNQGWRLRHDERGFYEIDLRLNGEAWTLRLAGGHGFCRQNRQMDRIIDGSAIKGELAFLRKKVDEEKYKIMAKMVAWFPKQETQAKDRKETLKLSTSDNWFWDALYPGQHEIWRINADHVRNWIVGHERMRQRLYQDRKITSAEWRQRELDRRCKKQHNRLNSFMQMSCASVSTLAVRTGVSAVEYDDTERSYMPSFPWFMLREILRNKLDEHNIELIMVASTEVPTETPEALAEEEVSE